MTDHQPTSLSLQAPKSGLLALLQTTVTYSFNNTTFYQEHLKKHIDENITINSIEDFQKLPFTTKDNVTQSFPFGMLATPIEQVIAYYESSGTTNNNFNGSSKIPSFLTRNDLNLDVKRRLMNKIEVTESDVILNSLPFAYTSCGLAFQLAFQSKNAMLIACNSDQTYKNFLKQSDISKYLRPTILLTPHPFSYALLNEKLATDQLKSIVLCGIPTSENAKKKASLMFNNADVHDVYGLSEFGAITYSCQNKNKHIIAKDFYIEIINPQTGKPCQDKEFGEIVITTLTREASPKIRYRTGDWGRVISNNCCSNSSPTLEIKGRLKEAIMINKSRIFPTDIENIICRIPESNGIYKIKYNPQKRKLIIHLEAQTNIRKRSAIKLELISLMREFFDLKFSIKISSPRALYPKFISKNLGTNLKLFKNFKLTG